MARVPPRPSGPPIPISASRGRRAAILLPRRPRARGRIAGGSWLLIHGTILGLFVAGYFLYPVVMTMLNTVSTDDAYVNGHVTFVAPRVAGQVSRSWWMTIIA